MNGVTGRFNSHILVKSLQRRLLGNNYSKDTYGSGTRDPESVGCVDCSSERQYHKGKRSK